VHSGPSSTLAVNPCFKRVYLFPVLLFLMAMAEPFLFPPELQFLVIIIGYQHNPVIKFGGLKYSLPKFSIKAYIILKYQWVKTIVVFMARCDTFTFRRKENP
jgi:hypothetical protein